MSNTFPDLDALFEDNYELTVPATLHRVAGDVVISGIFERTNNDITIGDAQILTATPTLEVRQADVTDADLNLSIDIHDVTLGADGVNTPGAVLYTYYIIALKPLTEGSVILILSEDQP